MENPAPIIVRIQKIREYGYVFVAWIDGRVMCGVGHGYICIISVDASKAKSVFYGINWFEEEEEFPPARFSELSGLASTCRCSIMDGSIDECDRK
ncbi:hypothetical protein M513_13855 [Trichuris suis]|uniref:Uncharacterized protein n=1 Tax=Trichuris suis TaxID=68888 RepID=A0A085LJX2_9BILA|nr:hypothetical protein M513_13855 [Trichuris suis]